MGLNYREIKRRFDCDPGRAQTELVECIRSGEIKPDEFRLRPLFEATVPDGRELVEMFQPGGGFSLMEAGQAVDTARFANITGQVVYSKIMEASTGEAFVFTNLVKNVPTGFSGERIPGISGIGNESEAIGEGQYYPLAGVNEDYVDTPVTEKSGLIVPVTKEAIFFDRTGVLLNRCSQVGEVIGVRKELKLIDAFIDENRTDWRHKWKGTTYATFQTSTPWINSKTSNPLTDWTNVDAAEQLFMNMVDPGTGLPMIMYADSIVVTSQLLQAANRIMNATESRWGSQSTSVPNTVGQNPYQNKYKVVTSRFLAPQLATDTNWFLTDFNKSVVYFENWPTTVTQAPSNSEAEFTQDIVLRFKASERGTPFVMEPRAIVKSAA